MRPSTLLSALVLSAACALSAGARAGDMDDTVLLTNGGRIRGTVMVEDPGKGVTIRLPDGTTRVLKPSEVARVDYGQPAAAAPPAAPPAPVAAAALPPAAPPPGYPPAYYGQPGYPPPDYAGAPPATHRRTGLLVTGIILMGAGIIALPVGGALVAASDGADTCSTPFYNGSYYEYTYHSCTDDGMQTAGIGVAAGGGVALAAGIPFLILGLIKVKNTPDSALPSAPPRRAAATWSPTVRLVPSVGDRRYGLALVGSM